MKAAQGTRRYKFWTEEQKMIMNQSFSYYLRNKLAPTVAEVIDFIQKAGPLFNNVSYMQVRRYFYNKKYSHGKKSRKFKKKHTCPLN